MGTALKRGEGRDLDAEGRGGVGVSGAKPLGDGRTVRRCAEHCIYGVSYSRVSL